MKKFSFNYVKEYFDSELLKASDNRSKSDAYNTVKFEEWLKTKN